MYNSKVDLVFHPSEVDEMCTSYSWGHSCESKLSPHKRSAALRQMNPIHKQEA